MSTQSLRFGRTKIPPDQSSTKHPHLSIVQIFKEPLHPAAKKRDYEQPTPPRQASRTPNLQLRDPRLPRHTTHQNSAHTAKEPRSISTQKTLSSTPQTPTHAKNPRHPPTPDGSVTCTRREIFEAGAFPTEGQPHGTRGAVTVLADDELCRALVQRIRVVHLILLDDLVDGRVLFVR